MVKEISIDQALDSDDLLLIDVRSEMEYSEATIPGAVNVPILGDEERSAVGTLYRIEGPEPARRLALALVAPKMAEKISEICNLAAGKKVAVFCWRGGMRSQYMASVLKTAGLPVYRVIGGYKAYRRYVYGYLDREELTQKAVVLNGLTGVGKTDVLIRLAQKGFPALDLEGLAEHRGSVFGKIGLPPSPTQKSFESSIVWFLKEIGEKSVFVVECESRRVGKILLPVPLLNSIKNGIQVLLYTSLENRVKRIRDVYTNGPGENVKELQHSTSLLKNKIGAAKAEALNSMLEQRSFELVFTYLLKNYYDPLYRYPDGPSDEYALSVDTTDIEEASEKVFNFVKNL